MKRGILMRMMYIFSRDQNMGYNRRDRISHISIIYFCKNEVAKC